MFDINEDSLKLLRHQLASIDLGDIEKEEMSEAETKEYNASISAVFPRLEKDIKKFLYEQILFAVNQSNSWEQVIFARGTYNGMNLLLHHWRNAFNQHNERIKNEGEDKKFDRNKIIGEIESRS